MTIARPVLWVFLSALATACGSLDVSPAVSTLAGNGAPPDCYRPDPALTPGHLCDRDNPDFDEVRYGARIDHCRRNVSSHEKDRVAGTYGLSEQERRDHYEIDHLIPLSIGGSNEPENLWPLWGPWAREKSEFEQVVHANVASGEWTQAQAIAKLHAWRPASQSGD